MKTKHQCEEIQHLCKQIIFVRNWLFNYSLGLFVVAFLNSDLSAESGNGFVFDALFPPKTGDCISTNEREIIELRIKQFHAEHGYTIPTQAPQPAQYAFFPQAGNILTDLWRHNFVDLDPTTGILDWDCTDYTYDGHHGIDCNLKSFAEKRLDVPIFVALDGLVVEAHDGEPDENTVQMNIPANLGTLKNVSSVRGLLGLCEARAIKSTKIAALN